MSSIVDFHRPIAVRSASPRPDREPEKRNQPPTPPREHVEPPRETSPFSPEAVETYRKSEQLGIDVAGVISSRAFIGKAADGRTPKGALPWWWCYGHQPVHVPGAVYADSDEGRHLVKAIGEAALMRADRDAFLATLDPSMVVPRNARERRNRRVMARK